MCYPRLLLRVIRGVRYSYTFSLIVTSGIKPFGTGIVLNPPSLRRVRWKGGEPVVEKPQEEFSTLLDVAEHQSEFRKRPFGKSVVDVSW